MVREVLQVGGGQRGPGWRTAASAASIEGPRIVPSERWQAGRPPRPGGWRQAVCHAGQTRERELGPLTTIASFQSVNDDRHESRPISFGASELRGGLERARSLGRFDGGGAAAARGPARQLSPRRRAAPVLPLASGGGRAAGQGARGRPAESVA